MTIPIIDLEERSLSQLRSDRDLAEAVDEALATVGSFVLTGHGVPLEILDRLRASAQRFFVEPEALKRESGRPRRAEVARGYLGVPDSEVCNMGMQRFSFGPWATPDDEPYFSSEEGRAHFPQNCFPTRHADFEAAARVYFDAVMALSSKVAALFESALVLEPGALVDLLEGSTATATAIRYPGGHAPVAGGMRIQAHNDVDLYTILYIHADDTTDLQFLDRDNIWNEVPAVLDGFVINVGDLMQHFTNDRWLATPHKVVIPSGRGETPDRFSVAFFEHPRYDANVAPFAALVGSGNTPRYEAVRVADFERTRRMLLHLGGKDPNAELADPVARRLSEAGSGLATLG